MSNDNIAKISIIEGDSIEIIGGSHTEYVGKITYSSSQKLFATAVNGKLFGDKPESAPFGHYIKNAWWSSDKEGKKKIKSAEMGDTAYFHIEMTNKYPELKLPEEEQNVINFKLYLFEGFFEGKIMDVNFKVTMKNKDQVIEYVTWDDVNKNNEIDDDEKSSIKPYNKVEIKENKAVLTFPIKESLNRLFNEDKYDKNTRCAFCIGEIKLFI